MKSIFKWILLAPILIIVLDFAVINRQPVKILLDPFGNPNSALSATLPLFLALFAAVAIGVILGGAVTWFGQAPYRRLVRSNRSELARLQGELASAKARNEAGRTDLTIRRSSAL